MTPPSEPNAKQKQVYGRLSKLSGDKFDAAFAKEMVKDHKQDIKAFEKGAQDPAISLPADGPRPIKSFEAGEITAK